MNIVNRDNCREIKNFDATPYSVTLWRHNAYPNMQVTIPQVLREEQVS